MTIDEQAIRNGSSGMAGGRFEPGAPSQTTPAPSRTYETNVAASGPRAEAACAPGPYSDSSTPSSDREPERAWLSTASVARVPWTSAEVPVHDRRRDTEPLPSEQERSVDRAQCGLVSFGPPLRAGSSRADAITGAIRVGSRALAVTSGCRPKRKAAVPVRTGEREATARSHEMAFMPSPAEPARQLSGSPEILSDLAGKVRRNHTALLIDMLNDFLEPTGKTATRSHRPIDRARATPPTSKS